MQSYFFLPATPSKKPLMRGVMNVTVESGKFKAGPDFPALPEHFQPISFDHGFQLGKTEEAVVRLPGT